MKTIKELNHGPFGTFRRVTVFTAQRPRHHEDVFRIIVVAAFVYDRSKVGERPSECPKNGGRWWRRAFCRATLHGYATTR
jgi:hypothetical protein